MSQTKHCPIDVEHMIIDQFIYDQSGRRSKLVMSFVPGAVTGGRRDAGAVLKDGRSGTSKNVREERNGTATEHLGVASVVALQVPHTASPPTQQWRRGH